MYDRLAVLAPPPATASRAAVIAGDRAALETWWDALGLGSIAFWREWKRQWPDGGAR